MPNYFDFTQIDQIKEIKINPFGWVNPIYIQYGIVDDISGKTYKWKVKGTNHTFSILVQRMNFLSLGDYDRHFTEVLEKFREDYLSWKSDHFSARWMQEYRDEFERFII